MVEKRPVELMLGVNLTLSKPERKWDLLNIRFEFVSNVFQLLKGLICKYKL